MEDNVFDEFDNYNVISPETSKQEKPAKEYIVVAFQLIRKKKVRTMGGELKYDRTIIDTICVENGETEMAKNRAVEKARLHGDCMVMELNERVIISIMERVERGTTLYKNGAKKLARVRNR